MQNCLKDEFNLAQIPSRGTIRKILKLNGIVYRNIKYRNKKFDSVEYVQERRNKAIDIVISMIMNKKFIFVD